MENKNYIFDPNSFKKLFKLKFLFSWLTLGLLAILAFLPNRLRDAIAIILSYPLSLIPIKPRRIAYANLRVCFVNKSAKECRVIYRKMLRVLIVVALSYAQASVLPNFLFKRSWDIKGLENLYEAMDKNKSIIFLASHTFALDRCGLYLSYLGLPMFCFVNKQKNEVFDWFLNKQRLKYGGKVLYRQSGIKSMIRELKAGNNAYFLADEDLGNKGSCFINFFGVPKSTISAVPVIAKLSDALVVNIFAMYNFKTAKFELHFFPYNKSYPTDNMQEDVATNVKILEQMLEKYPEQYMWLLRIFKTTPSESYPDIYANTYVSLLKKGNKIDYQARRKPFNN